MARSMARSTGLSFTSAACCVLVLTVAAVPAKTPKTSTARVDPYVQQFAATLTRSQDSATGASKQLGTTLDDALQAKQVARLSVIVKCNHYDVIEVIYRDGSIKVVDDPRAPIGRNEPLDRDQLDSLASSLPGFVWGEIECDS
jgi:hypothetical protein